jgi:hypothetical protein
MLIEITAPEPPFTRDYKIYEITDNGTNAQFLGRVNEDQVYNLLTLGEKTDKEYDNFTQDGKFRFIVTKKRLYTTCDIMTAGLRF